MLACGNVVGVDRGLLIIMLECLALGLFILCSLLLTYFRNNCRFRMKLDDLLFYVGIMLNPTTAGSCKEIYEIMSQISLHYIAK